MKKGNNSMKTAMITFHNSYNYGSVLQAYALQNVIMELVGNCEIINFQTERQTDLYSIFTKRKGIKYIFKNLARAVHYKALKKKNNSFYNFIIKHLNTTEKVFYTLEDIEKANLDYDAYICGSDQIWNPVPADFDWAYYLPFVKNKKKISYATSFGQLGLIASDDIKKRISEYVSDFDFISVREKKSSNIIKELTGREHSIVLDPTFLLEKEQWNKLITNEVPYPNKYILFYTLFADKDIIKIISYISKQLKLPIITTNFSNQYDVFSLFKKKYGTGPVEFISLVKNAELIVTTSYHGTAFSIIYNKPFFAIRGDKDARIASVLDMLNLKDRIIDENNINIKLNEAFNISFNTANMKLEQEKTKSMEFLKRALE